MNDLDFLWIAKPYLHYFAKRSYNLRLRSGYTYKARIRVRATTPAIPQIARRSYRSRTRRVRCRTSVLSISLRMRRSRRRNESATCNENPFNGRTRLEFRLIYYTRPSSARAIILARIIDCTVLSQAHGALKQWNESWPFKSKVCFVTVSETVPLKLLLARRGARNRIRCSFWRIWIL